MRKCRTVSVVVLLSSMALSAQIGDAARGQSIYGNQGCAGCHMIRGRGGYVGPDLTLAGATRTVPQLRESLLKPSARIADRMLVVAGSPVASSICFTSSSSNPLPRVVTTGIPV